MTTKLFLVRATHPTNPGVPTSLHYTPADAAAKALELTEMLMRDVVTDCPTSDELRAEGEPPFTPDNWRVYLRRAQVARMVEADGVDVTSAAAAMTAAAIEAEANDQPDPLEWLADQSGMDVWITELDAEIPPVRIVLNMTGGVLQGASIDHGAIDMLVIDYDRESLDPRNEITVPQPDECEGQEANVVPLGAFDVAPEWVEAVFAAHDAPRCYAMRWGTRADQVGKLAPMVRDYDAIETECMEIRKAGNGHWARVERVPFPHTPDRCPSSHWNRGDDVCVDCGTVLS